MELILKEDVKNLGFKNDVVKVKPGYGRNYLIPQGMAVLATSSNRKVMEENLRQAAHKAFGAVTSLQISDALNARGFNVDRKRISLPAEVKNLGEYEATLTLHKQVIHKIRFVVVAE